MIHDWWRVLLYTLPLPQDWEGTAHVLTTLPTTCHGCGYPVTLGAASQA